MIIFSSFLLFENPFYFIFLCGRHKRLITGKREEKRKTLLMAGQCVKTNAFVMDWMPQPKKKKIGGSSWWWWRGWKMNVRAGSRTCLKDIWRNRKKRRRRSGKCGHFYSGVWTASRTFPLMRRWNVVVVRKTSLVFITDALFSFFFLGRWYHFYKGVGGSVRDERRLWWEGCVVRDWFTMLGLKSGLWSRKAFFLSFFASSRM